VLFERSFHGLSVSPNIIRSISCAVRNVLTNRTLAYVLPFRLLEFLQFPGVNNHDYQDARIVSTTKPC
jgi:hypothetical protein